MEKIIDRIRKLFALAGNNSNEAEALAALEKAHALLQGHNLTIQEIERAGGQTASADHEREQFSTETTMPERYFSWVWNSVSKLHYCTVIYSRPNPKRYKTFYYVIGRRVNVIVATEMALYLCQTMRRCLAVEVKATGRNDHAFKNAFMTGMANRLCARMKEMMEQAETKASTGNAVVLWSADEAKLNKEFAESRFKLRTSRSVSTRVDKTGYLAGQQAGDGVSFNRQVDGAGRPRGALT